MNGVGGMSSRFAVAGKFNQSVGLSWFFRGMVLLSLAVPLRGMIEIEVVGPDPVAGARVWLGEASAFSDAAGIARFLSAPEEPSSLRVEHPAYDRHESVVEFRSNKERRTVTLQPVEILEFRGSVVDAFSGTPVPGARLALEAVSCEASVSGNLEAMTDWDGTFALQGVLAGSYRCRLSAPGFDAREFELEIDTARSVVDLKLQASVGAVEDLEIRLRDTVSGLPVKAAMVRLEEGLGVGFVTEQTTDEAGRVHFRQIKLGRHNRSNGSDQALTVRNLLAVVSAPGYHTTAYAVQIGTDYDLPLDPVREIEEQEPNNEFATAQVVLANDRVVHRIAEVGDEDTFGFSLVADAHVRIESTPAPLERYMRVFNSAGELLFGKGGHANHNIVCETGLAKGDYFVAVGEWGNNGFSPEPLGLDLKAHASADGLEPNNSPDEARLIEPGVAIRGVIFPRGDLDCFRFSVERPGLLRYLLEPHPLERYAQLLDSAGRSVASRGAHGDQLLDFLVQVPSPGEYTLVVGEWGNNGESTVPYTSTLEFISDDLVDDPPLDGVSLAMGARPLELNRRVSNTILPVADLDVYRIDLPSAGRVHCTLTAPIEHYMRILDAAGATLTGRGEHAGRTGGLSYAANGPETVFLVVGEWGDNGFSTQPYTLSTWWEPVEDRERVQRNETVETATPVGHNFDVTGTIHPVGDQDYFMLQVPFPGVLEVTGETPIESYLQILDQDGKALTSRGFHRGPFSLSHPVFPGIYFVRLQEWGNNGESVAGYYLLARLHRAEPAESVPLREDEPRILVSGLGQAFRIDLVGDRDTYLYETAGGDAEAIILYTPIETYVRVFDDRTGKVLFQAGRHAGLHEIPLTTDQPTRFRIELTEWGDNGFSHESGFLRVAPPGSGIVAERVVVERAPEDGKVFYLSRTPLEGGGLVRPEEVSLDLDRDGVADIQIPREGEARLEMDEHGANRALVRLLTAGNGESRQELWLETVEETAQEGIALALASPAAGEIVAEPKEIAVHAVSMSQGEVTRVEFLVDGQLLHTDYSPPFTFPVDWSSLTGADHRLLVRARNSRGEEAELPRNFSMSEFFGLQPARGAVLTGEQVRVSWLGHSFGEAKVRYREAGGGEDSWADVEGEAGRFRSVLLPDLSAGKEYEFQALDGAGSSELRTFKLVKGLAFGRPSYGANLKRDYDQRMGISVRNNGDLPLMVQLECGQPENSLLLVGFVGDGSEDRPFELQPGEEREFMLGMSAQDVVKEEHVFPIRMAAENGLADEAIVRVNVRLPRVELAWEPLGPTEYGLGERFRLVNKGDAVTDLSVRTAGPGSTVSPAVFHGLLPAGGRMDVTVRPELFSGFQSLSTELLASTLDKTFATPVKIAVPEGKKTFRVNLIPGVASTDTPEYLFYEDLMAEAATLDPEGLEWDRALLPEDLSGDGEPDRWTLVQNNTEWVGDDTDADGVVDFVHADIYQDGVFEYSALREGDGWVQTNLVEAWLEMGFSLPWAASAYHPHDLDIILNGEVIGSLQDTIPNGNYRFYLPPGVIRFNEAGVPEGNEVGIRSTHLRGGHYVVNSDFRFSIRMTATPTWSVGSDLQDAFVQAANLEGLSLSRPDMSVSSADLILEAAEPVAGEIYPVRVPLRSLGAVVPEELTVALVDRRGGGEAEELVRVVVGDLAVDRDNWIALPWRARPGHHELAVVVDPDGETDDSSRLNNEARTSIFVPGDDSPPSIRILGPGNGEVSKTSVVTLEFEAEDDQEIRSIEGRVDSGMWVPLMEDHGDKGPGVSIVKALLQPGRHLVTLRVVDSAGNVAEVAVDIVVEVPAPDLTITFPKPDVDVLARSTHVLLSCSPGSLLAAARVAGGPWYRATMTGSIGRSYVPLAFGKQTLEAMVVNRAGTVTMQRLEIHCGRQPLPTGEADRVPPAQDGVVEVEGFGPMDVFSAWNQLR